jgi:tetratricopeptide (TPR) repeat protein
VEQAPARGRVRLTRRHLLLALLVVSLAGLAAGGGWLLLRSRTDLPRPGQLGVLDDTLLRRTLTQRGLPADELINPLSPGPALRKLVQGLDQVGDPKKRALAVARRVAARLQGAGVDLMGEGHAPVRTPATLLARLQGKGQPQGPERKQKSEQKGEQKREQTVGPPRHLLSYELATLMVAALRAADLEAVLGIRPRVDDAPMPTADPRGGLARYAAAVYAPGTLGKAPPVAVLDPVRALSPPSWAGKGGDASMLVDGDGLKPLDDASAAAHLLALRAFRVRQENPKRAVELSYWALQASAPSPTLRVLRAEVLGAAGGRADAVSEAQKALALRKDPPRLVAVANALLVSGQAEQALTLAREAIKLDPKYWPAHLLLAVLLLQPKREEGEKHLHAAQEVAPEAPEVKLVQALDLLGQGQPDLALPLLREVVAARPREDTRLLLYQLLSARGEAEEASRLRQALLTDSRDRTQTRRRLEGVDKALEQARQQAAGAPPAGPQEPTEVPKIPQFKLPDVTIGQ